MRPLCGKKHGGNRKSQGALARLCEFPGRFRIYRAQRSQQGCSLSLGMLRLAEPPTGRARLRSSLKSPRNPITPIETSRVATLHPGLYKGLQKGARRVIGASDARELLPPPAGGPPPSKREVFGEGLRGDEQVSLRGAKGDRGDRKAPICNRPQNRRFCWARSLMGNDCIACGLCRHALR